MRPEVQLSQQLRLKYAVFIAWERHRVETCVDGSLEIGAVRPGELSLILLVDWAQMECLLSTKVCQFDIHPARDRPREIALRLCVADENDFRVWLLYLEE